MAKSLTATLAGVDGPGVLLVHLNIIVYALAFWLTTPMLPYLLKEFGATSLNFGMFQSLFAAVQLGGGLTVGFLQDRTSSTSALSITQLGATAVYVSLYFATSLTTLYVSRIFTVLQQSMQVAQAYVSKRSTAQGRAVAFSRLSVSYAIGMMIGSMSSGVLAERLGNHAVMAIAAGLTAAMVVVNALFLPADTQAPGATRGGAADKKKSDSPTAPSDIASKDSAADANITGYWTMLLSLKRVFAFLATLFASRAIYDPVFTLVLVDKYHIEQADMGRLVSLVSMVGLLANVVVLPMLLKATSEYRVQFAAIVTAASGYLVVAVFDLTDYRAYGAVTLVVGACAAVLYTTATSYLTAKVPTNIHGQAVASTHALRSLVGVAGPLIGTGLMEAQGPGWVAGVCAALLVGGLAVM